MKVTFRQSGGWGGMFWGAELDTSAIPAEEAAQLRSLVEESGILTGEITGGGFSTTARDAQTYELDIEINGDLVKLAFDDTTVPDSAEALLQFLRSKAVPGKPD